MVRQKKRERLRVLSYRKEGSISKKREKLEYYTMCKNATSGVSQLDNWGTYVDKFVFTVKEYHCKVCKAIRPIFGAYSNLCSLSERI